MKKQWYRLDNAALIFPAVMRKNWNNVFRVSVTLKEPVDPELLSRAAEDLLLRGEIFRHGQDFRAATFAGKERNKENTQ